MDRKIVLLGDLGEKFGAEWSASANTIVDSIKLIECQTTGFKQYMLQALEAGLDLAVLCGDTLIEDERELLLENIPGNTIYISLIPSGSKGLGKILAAVAIAVFAFYAPQIFATPKTLLGAEVAVTPGWVGTFQAVATAISINLALQGVSELLVKTPDTIEEEDAGNIFSGPENTTKQGKPVPLLYGRLLVGGSVLSVDISSTTEEQYGNTISTSGLGGALESGYYGSDQELMGGSLTSSTQADFVLN